MLSDGKHGTFIANRPNVSCGESPVAQVPGACRQCCAANQPLLAAHATRMDASVTRARPVIYDMTRLVTRVTTDTPNGIDRVDMALAKHFAFRPDMWMQALIVTIAGPRLVPACVARAIVQGIEAWWQESEGALDDLLYEQVVARLTGAGSGAGCIVQPKAGRWGAALNALWNYGLRLGRSPARTAPHGAAYIHASNFPLEYGWHVRWLHARPDITPVFFIHDLLPIEWPQYFWAREPERHRQRLEHIRQLRGRAIVASAAVAARVKSHFAGSGYAIPILQAALPVAPVFHAPPRPDPRLAARPYFIACGSIEPRKNHVLLLHIWRQLVQELGDRAPALVIAGKRGWNSESAVDLLERSRAISRHVVEVAGLPTPALKRLMDSASAVLVPSLAEGFGLPVAEATAMQVPVIAADIAPFRERPAPGLTLIDPLDGLGWLEAIRERARAPRQRVERGAQAVSDATFMAEIERFVGEPTPR
jgi:glycosyltransferase involved in cell wall biosynthesis